MHGEWGQSWRHTSPFRGVFRAGFKVAVSVVDATDLRKPASLAIPPPAIANRNMVVGAVDTKQNPASKTRWLNMVKTLLAGMVALAMLAGPGNTLAAKAASESTAAPEQSDTSLPPDCQQKNRTAAECFSDSSAGVLARVWSRDPREPEATSRATCTPRMGQRLQGAQPVTTLRYEVCNFHSSRGLYFQWVAAGFQSGSDEDSLLRNHECACYDREVSEPKSGDAFFEANKPPKRFSLTTWRPQPSSLAERTFDIIQSLQIIGPDRSSQSRPKVRFWMRTRRDEGAKVVTDVSYEERAKVLIALPDLKPDAEDRVLSQLAMVGFRGTAVIVSTKDAVQQISENDRNSVGMAFQGTHRVLVLTTPFDKTTGSYSWKSDTNVFRNMPVAIAEPNTGRLRNLIFYSTVGEGR